MGLKTRSPESIQIFWWHRKPTCILSSIDSDFIPDAELA